MAPTMSYILLVFGVALLPAVNGQCINVTLPNILNLGECLGTTLRACPDTSSGLIPDLTRVLGCVLQILPQIGSPVSVLYNVVGLLEAVVSRLGLSADIGGLTDILCNPLGIPLFSCGTFSPGNIACRGTAPDQPAQRLQHRSVSEPDPLVLRRRINNFAVGCILSFTSLLPFRFLTRGITRAIRSLTNNLLGAVGNCNK
ncbi:hypothetical protein MTO96_017533 [Rhipicephalus appendiculatus]